LCERLLRAYELSTAEQSPVGGMWASGLFQTRQRGLATALASGDAEQLAMFLAGIFRSDAVVGMAGGSFGLNNLRRGARWCWSTHTVEQLLSLAESQGVVRAENPEQGEVAVALRTRELDSIVSALAQRLGARVGVPEVGSPYGLDISGQLITADWPDQIYGALRLAGAVEVFLPGGRASRIVEIGGGYGGMAYWLARILDSDIRIIDLPLVNVIQGYFLGQTTAPGDVSFYGEPNRRLAILPTHALDAIESPYDVLVNKDSMPEMPRQELRRYLQWTTKACRGIFYSYNQEGAAPFAGTAQNVVAEATREVAGFTLLGRDRSWLRNGYVEEIYRVGSCGPGRNVD
jgi:hypothetical protein